MPARSSDSLRDEQWAKAFLFLIENKRNLRNVFRGSFAGKREYFEEALPDIANYLADRPEQDWMNIAIRALMNKAISSARRERVRRSIPVDELQLSSVEPTSTRRMDRERGSDELLSRIKRNLKSMSPRQKKIMADFLEGQSRSAIAAKYGMNVGAAHMALKRAQGKLADEIIPYRGWRPKKRPMKR